MFHGGYDRQVFINCPFDAEHEQIILALAFTCIYLGYKPLLASLDLDSSTNRLVKITALMKSAKFSIHDLSRHSAKTRNEKFRMNMPFELGVDFGLKQSGVKKYGAKKFLIFEKSQYDLKASLSDTAGQDFAHHNDDYQKAVRETRDFIANEEPKSPAGADRILTAFESWHGWLIEIKIKDGHSETHAKSLKMPERIKGMYAWFEQGMPSFV